MLDINPKEEKKVDIEIEKEDDTNFDIPQSVVINGGLEVKEFQEGDEYLFWRVKGGERQEIVSVEEIRGYKGTDGVDGIDGLDGYTPMKGVDYFDGVDGKDGKNGKDGKDGKDGINGVDAYDMFLKEGGQDIGRQQFSEILRRNIEANWTIIGGNNGVQSITAGSNITVDNTDPRNPIINATGGGGGGGSVDSVFGRTGVVTAQSGDYTSDQVTETATRVFVTPTEKTAITHSNRAVLDATTASFTTADETKLDGIEALAEVNNISDANATDLTDGGTTSLHNHDDIYIRTASLGNLALLDTVDTAQIDNHAVTNTKLEQMNAYTVKGRLSGNGTPQDIDMADLPVSTATQTALDGKIDKNTPITGATKTKITYDADGLVTSGADAGISDITGLQTALDGKLPSTFTKAQLNTAVTDGDVAFLNSANTFTLDQAINAALNVSGTINANAPGANIRLRDDGTTDKDGFIGASGGSIYWSNFAATKGLRLWNNGNITTLGTGSVGIGTTSLTGINLAIAKNITGSTVGYGIDINAVAQTDVTNTARYIRTLVSNASGGSMTDITHMYLGQGTLNSVTNQTGILITSTLTGASNNYGIRNQVSSGTGRWGLFFDGTVQNHIRGNTGIGLGSTVPTTNLDIRGDHVAGRGLLTLQSTTGNISAITLYAGSTYSGSIYGAVDGTLNIFSGSTSTPINIQQSGTSRIYVGSTGNVGISTTTPTEALDVVGNAKVSGSIVRSNSITMHTGTGSPEGVTTASPGSIFQSTDGNIYRKSTGVGSTGWVVVSGGSSTKQHRITIPGEQVQDTANYQGLYFYNDTGATITISNVAVAVGKAAAGSGAAYSVNVYKSSGTAADGLNTSAVALFSSDIALTTSYTSLTNVPTTTTVESGRWVTMRVTSSAGATNRASDAQIIITYS